MEKLHTLRDIELLEFLDGALPRAAAQQLAADLRQSPEVAQRLDELRLIHQYLLAQKMEEPSPMFTQRVMGRLHRWPHAQGLSPRRGLWLLCGMVVACMLLVGVVSTDMLNAPLQWDALPLQRIQYTLPELTINMKWIFNTLILLTLGIALVLFDRTVLRPYFQRRAHIQL